MDAVAVDDRRAIEPGIVLEANFRRDVADRRRHLGDRHECAHIDDLGSRQYQNGPALPTDLGQPDLTAVHSSVHASASVQNESGRSGCRW